MTWVIAHRGASADERENTLPAFERAIELGAERMAPAHELAERVDRVLLERLCS